MGLTKAMVTEALRAAPAPGNGNDGPTDLVSARCVEWVAACDTYGTVKLHTPSVSDKDGYQQVARGAIEAVVRAAKGEGIDVTSLTVEFVNHSGDVVHAAKYAGEQAGQPAGEQNAPPSQPAAAPTEAGAGGGHRPIAGLGDRSRKPNPQDDAGPLPGVKHVIAVGAGKGGVGKSSIAVNLAVALARQGKAVGVLDADIYGPSLPTMLGLGALEQNVMQNMLQPFYVHGVKAITVGKLVDPEKPLIWRGPMAHGAFKQLTEQTEWGELDYLVIDLPPGTGDIPLTMAQMLQLTGAVIVCTPQQVAQDDAVRALRMFQQLGVDVLGVVENMSYFIGDDGKTYDLFGRGGAEQMAQRLAVPFLGAVPINTALRVHADSGDPSANFDPAKAGGPLLPDSLERLAKNLESQVALASMRQGRTKPTISIS